MPITIRDKQFDRRIAREAKRRGRISKTAALISVATERLDEIERQQRANPERPAEHQQPSIEPQLATA